ncbi:MAG: metallophosphoesterase family protein [Polyangiaceae bacterium]
MANRSFAIGDIHGDLHALKRVLAKFPMLDEDDTIILLGDYVDRGLESRQVIEFIRTDLPRAFPAKIVILRGNHEDGWLRVASGGWPEFLLPTPNGCLATLRSYSGCEHNEGDNPSKDEFGTMQMASFFPEEVMTWMGNLPFFYEDDHGIYVHAGLIREGGNASGNSNTTGRWLHPSETLPREVLLWVRTMDFFQNYRGKRVICGHTSTDNLPPELSSFTPEDPLDMWAHENVLAIDTGCGKGGFLTAVELPRLVVYESR